MRSDCTHMMFIDSDVSFNAIDIIAMLALDKEIIGGGYPKKCCPANAKIETEDGIKTIKWVVDNEYKGKVLSFDPETGQKVWKSVISHNVDKNIYDKKWVSLGRTGKQLLVVTDDHECATIENILFPENPKFIPAKDTVGKYIIKKDVVLGKYNTNPLYSKDQIEFLIGSMLGDGNIKKGYLGFGHSDQQRNYIELKQKLFGGKLGDSKKVGEYKGKSYYASFLDCPRNSQILKLEELMYFDSEIKVKKYIKNVLEFFTEKSLAFLYMDDGTMSYQKTGKPSVVLCLDSYTVEELELFKSLLYDKFNIETSITKINRLYVKSSSCDTFFNLIKKYIPFHMEYKIPEEYRNGEKYDYDSVKFLDYSAELVNTLKYIDNKNPNSHFQPAKLYDIGVEDTHCFFANGHLVHNCIKWPAIKKAVMKNPNISDSDLALLGGEIVFNPVAGMNQFQVSDLVEVMELGTGFMLISRQVLEKYQKNYPQRLYKPDHLGTQFFSGDREIYSYFNVEIDPESKRLWSEDYMFCQECRKIGIKVWMCPWIELSHTGTYVYSGSLPKLAQYLGEM